jgi:1-acyl-sn-glycerol-3-phosphate acyltransferase
MKEKKIIYYADEVNDEFSSAKIIPMFIDENYCYEHKGRLWNFISFILQNFLSMPIKIGFSKFFFHQTYIGKEKLKKYKNRGYFIYVNHTQNFADVFIPSLPVYPKRNYFIVNPENVSMKGLKHLVQMLGAIPIPSNKDAMKNFLSSIEYKIKKGYSITIYPEAHIWPYYTKIRPFKDVSFKYPIKYDTPVFCMTNTYQERKNGKVRITTYIDGPFFSDKTKSAKEQQKELRNKVYDKMVERSMKSNFEKILYKKTVKNKDKLELESNV